MSGFQGLKILFDARHIDNIYSGLGRYTYSLLINLIRDNSYQSLEIILDKNSDYKDNSLFLSLSGSGNYSITYLDAPLYKFKHHINISKYVNAASVDVYFYPHFDLPVFIKKTKSIFVVHDLIPLMVDDYILKFKYIKRAFFKYIIKINLYKTHTQCIAVSKSTKNDIINHISLKFQHKIKVVYEDAFEVVIKTDKNNIKVKEVLNNKYLFYIGDRRSHKNLFKMIEVYVLLKEKYNYEGDFVIAGSEANFNFDLDKKVDNIKGVKLLGKVSDNELSLLYENMDSLFFISRYEGFGLPIIEAAMAQKRIITSITTSCGEIAPKTALLLDPNSNSEFLANQCHVYLNNNHIINNSEYFENFSWSTSVYKIFFQI